jgi:hypothetical protein
MSFNFGGGSNRQSSNTNQSQQFDQTSTFRLSDRAYGLLWDQAGRLRGMDYQELDPNSVEGFLNPYQDQVVNATMGRLNYEGDRARAGLKSDMAASGAFGNNRRGILEAELEGQIDRNRTEALAGLNQRGYDQALAAAMAENQGRNAYGLDIQSLVSQLLLGSVGREGTERSYGTSSGTSATTGRTSGFNFGFSWAPRFPSMPGGGS